MPSGQLCPNEREIKNQSRCEQANAFAQTMGLLPILPVQVTIDDGPPYQCSSHVGFDDTFYFSTNADTANLLLDSGEHRMICDTGKFNCVLILKRYFIIHTLFLHCTYLLIFTATSCDKITILSTDSSINEGSGFYIDNVFGIYLFSYFDWSGNAVYVATIDGVNQFLHKVDTYWMVYKQIKKINAK